VAHDLAGDRRVAAQRATQLTYDFAAATVVQVHVLARQRGAPTVDAAVAVGLQSAQAASQQVALELLDVLDGRGHLALISPLCALLLPCSERCSDAPAPGVCVPPHAGTNSSIGLIAKRICGLCLYGKCGILELAVQDNLL
jgi:hypothetical protein